MATDVDSEHVSLELEPVELEELKQKLSFRDQFLILRLNLDAALRAAGLLDELGARVIEKSRQVDQL